jgi:hypothetical protein
VIELNTEKRDKAEPSGRILSSAVLAVSCGAGRGLDFAEAENDERKRDSET